MAATNATTFSSHILDTSLGIPAKGMKATLYKASNADLSAWDHVSSHVSNEDGRIRDFQPITKTGTYRMIFNTEDYFKANKVTSYFYPHVIIDFNVELGQHYHIPLLISPFGYSTYRGS
jgi:5-hydroxyisourate hydrolase